MNIYYLQMSLDSKLVDISSWRFSRWEHEQDKITRRHFDLYWCIAYYFGGVTSDISFASRAYL